MTLPTMQLPIFEVNLTSRGVTKFRPFIVKEQKILMQAVESGDLKTIVSAIKQVASACLMEKIDMDALPMVDLELLFLNLRARSMGEVMDVYYKCTNEVDKKPCGMIIEVPVNLLNIKVTSGADVSNKIDLGNNIGAIMHYPSFDLLGLLTNAKDNIDAEFIVIAGCIDSIYDKDNVYQMKDAKPEEIQNFVMNLPTDKYELMKKFVVSAPKVSEEIKHQCPKCQFDHKFTLEGLADFFQ